MHPRCLFVGIVHDLDASTFCFSTPRRIGVVTHNAPAGGHQVSCKCAAHNAEADHADGAFGPSHRHSPSLRCGIASTSSRSLLCVGCETVESREHARRL